jgi:hypothetical protein
MLEGTGAKASRHRKGTGKQSEQHDEGNRFLKRTKIIRELVLIVSKGPGGTESPRDMGFKGKGSLSERIWKGNGTY